MAKILGKPNADDVKRVAVAALVAALDDSKEHARKNPRLTGVRAVATGAVLYTAGKAALNGRRFVNERLRGNDDEPEDEGYDGDEELDEDDEEIDGEPVAEQDEDFEDEDEPDDAEEIDEEPVAEDEDDEDFDDEDEEPEDDDDFDDEEDDEEDDERSAASEPPVHPDDDDIDEEELPARPSRKRTPVGRR